MRISGKNLSFSIGDLKLNAVTWSVSITDNSAVSKTNGVPDGYVDGDVDASGDIELNTQNFNLLMKVAKQHGSFRGMPTFDCLGYGKTSQDELKIEMFGVKLKLSEVVNADSNGGSALTHKIPFDITDSDFVKINGVPYLRRDEINGIY